MRVKLTDHIIHFFLIFKIGFDVAVQAIAAPPKLVAPKFATVPKKS